jgi:transglutaminase/protease-like cytokinesis protein 3
VPPTSASIAVAGTAQLTATVLPANASNKNVTWTTSNAAVASVSTTGLVTGIAAGTATITVTTVNGAKTATCVVTVTGGSTSCAFGAPLATALPTLAKSYNYVYVLGTGPSFANVSNFTINWDLANKGLWQFSMNTKDGKPNWYVDLRSYATQTFTSVQPAITFTGTGFPGLDGSYYAAIDNGNFVLVSKTGGFTIYFSTSATAPVCTKSAREDMLAENSDILFPNPFTNTLTLKVNNAKDIKSVKIVNQLGTVVKLIDVNQLRNNQIEIGTGLPAGIYFIQVNDKETTKTYKVVRR